jgi:Flp pilus assembly protein TadG
MRAHLKGRSRGQSLVEFALIVPVLLLVLSLAADFGRVFYAYVAVQSAVKEGALYGAQYPLCDDASPLCPDPGNVRWRVQQEAANQPTSAIVPAVQCVDATTGLAHLDLRNCVEGDTYVVTAQYQFSFITPLVANIVGSPTTIGATSQATVLNVAFDPTPGMAPVKLVDATQARNFTSEINGVCVSPEGTNFYRAPCVNPATGQVIPLDFRTGDAITYKISVRNNGGTNLTGVTLSDSRGWPGSCPPPPMTLAVASAGYSCTFTRIAVAPPSGTAVDYANVLTADSAETVAFTDTATVHIDLPPPDLRVLTFVSPYRKGSDGDGVASFGTTGSQSVFYSAKVPGPFVWYKVFVENIGAQTATGVTITDSNGPLPTNADCPARPSSIAAGASYTCFYKKTFSSGSPATNANTVSVAAANETAGANNDNSATVAVAACTGTKAVVPNMVGLTKSAAATAWKTGAGFSTTLTTWSGSTSALVLTQNRLAFTCLATNSTGSVSRVTTP